MSIVLFEWRHMALRTRQFDTLAEAARAALDAINRGDAAPERIEDGSSNVVWKWEHGLRAETEALERMLACNIQ